MLDTESLVFSSLNLLAKADRYVDEEKIGHNYKDKQFPYHITENKSEQIKHN